MAVNTCKLAFFSKKKLQKIALPLGLIASGGWGVHPRPPAVMRLSYSSLLNTSTKLDICTF